MWMTSRTGPAMSGQCDGAYCVHNQTRNIPRVHFFFLATEAVNAGERTGRAPEGQDSRDEQWLRDGYAVVGDGDCGNGLKRGAQGMLWRFSFYTVSPFPRGQNPHRRLKQTGDVRSAADET